MALIGPGGLGGCGSGPVLRADPLAVVLPGAWVEQAVVPAVVPARGALDGPPDGPSAPPVAGMPAWRLDDAALNRLLVQAAQANTSIQTAQGVLREARALREVAAAGLWPAVDASAAAQRSRTGRNAAVNTYSIALDGVWTLDVFGTQRDAVAIREASAWAAAESLASVQADIATELTLAYFSLRSAQARRLIAEENLLSQQDTLKITRWRVQAGLLTSLEGQQALAASEQAAALLPAWQTLIDQTAHALAVLTGQPPAALLAELATHEPLPTLPGDPVTGAPADTVRRRPDVRAAQYRVSAAMASLEQARAARWPSVGVSGSLGLTALTLGTLSSAGAVVRALAAQVSVPVLDGGALAAQVQAQQAALEQARSAWQAVVLLALQDVEDARTALQGDRQQLLRLQNAAQAATQAALLARQRYAGGLVDYQTVLETQRTRLATQDGVAAAQANVSADQVRLAAALGLGWLGQASAPPLATEPGTSPS